MPRSIFSIGRWTPITPVEATTTSRGESPSLAAASSVMRSASARPRSAVQALALPALTTTAWQRPERSRSSDSLTGAARTLLRVKTPAAVAGRSEAMMQRSSDCPSFLIPAWTAPAEKPAASVIAASAMGSIATAPALSRWERRAGR